MSQMLWGFLLVLMIGLAQAKTLAILDFEGDAGIEKSQLQAVTDRFQAEVIDSKVFNAVVDRKQIGAILAEQGMVESGACDSDQCDVQVGQLLGVDKLASGHLVRIEGVWTLSIRYIDVSSGQLEKIISLEVNGALMDVMRTGCTRAAMSLAQFVDPSRVIPEIVAADSLKQDSIAVSNASLKTDKDTNSLAVATIKDSKAGPVSLITPTQPEAQQKPRWKTPVLVGLGAFAVGAVVGAVFADATVVDARVAYEDLPAGSSADEFDAEAKRGQDAETLRTILLSTGAGLLATGIVIYVAF